MNTSTVQSTVAPLLQKVTGTNQVFLDHRNGLPAGSTETTVKTASLSGFVYRDANGNSTRDTGEAGLAGARVVLTGNFNRTVSGNSAVFVGATREVATTDAAGKYTFSQLPAGVYTISVLPPGSFHATGPTVGNLGGARPPRRSARSRPARQRPGRHRLQLRHPAAEPNLPRRHPRRQPQGQRHRDRRHHQRPVHSRLPRPTGPRRPSSRPASFPPTARSPSSRSAPACGPTAASPSPPPR